MKKSLIILIILAGICSLYSQESSDYFPQSGGFKWNFKTTPLDSSNNEIDSLSFFQVDSFAVSTLYEGKDAKLVLSKSGPIDSINDLSYFDSTFYAFEGAETFQYFNSFGIFDSIPLPSNPLNEDNISKLQNISADLEGWYSVYRFDQNVGSEYEIVEFDTTIAIDTIEVPLVIEVTGQRLDDEELETPIGTFNCKKFLTTIKVSVVIIPIPPITLELVSFKDTSFIAENNWIVKHVIPSTNTTDLSEFGIPSVTIPGFKTELTNEIPSGFFDENISVEDYRLFQNYPNPFNPATKISFNIPERSKVKLTVYDILGNKVAEIVNGVLARGSYQFNFNAENLSSGMYIYEFKTNNFIKSKKMLLLK